MRVLNFIFCILSAFLCLGAVVKSDMQHKPHINALPSQAQDIRYEKPLPVNNADLAPAEKKTSSTQAAMGKNEEAPKPGNWDKAARDLDISSQTNAQTDADKKLWNLRDVDIRAVIAEVSRVTHKNFLVDPRVQGKISIFSNTPISDKALYPVFLSALQVSGYAAIPSGDVTKILPNMEARTQSPDGLTAPNNIHNPRSGDDLVVQVIPVEHASADQMVPILRPLMPQWSIVSSYAPTNMLILSGRASNIKQMTEIIRQVDTSSGNGVDVVPLQNSLAMDVVNTLRDLMSTQVSNGTSPQLTLAADDRSNSILISGSKTDRLRLRVLILQLDGKGHHSADSNTQVIYLHYMRSEDVVPILAGIAQANFSGTVGTTIGTITRPPLDSTNPESGIVNVQAAASGDTLGINGNSSNNPGSTQTESGTKPMVQIIAEPNTNSVIINGPTALIRTLKSVVGQLDIKPAQLLIEGMVAEINENDFKSLGVEWGSINQDGHKTDSFRAGFAVLNSQTSISDFQAQIYALARQRKANILSTPSVVVLDNRQAKILVGKQVSVATSSYPNNAGGTTTASPFTTFDRMNVALHLYVRPQITRGQGIQMQIDQGLDTLDPLASSGDANTIPTFNISAIVTSVHVDSGDVVILGGLNQDSLASDNLGIPILGDIPGIGRLFQHNITNREKKVLMVFIRPVILQSEASTVNVSGAKYNDTRLEQLSIARSQESFNQKNKDTVLKPLKDAKLPKPFKQEKRQK
ncbi:MAG: secretin N-terminal domain-containing protein [Legionellaceae bacterium]|nr:secretin N-terminal domain-containing protein [Legionellaceae bacterium]